MITTKTFNLSSITSENDLVNRLMETAASAREEAVLTHLNDLISKGILVIKPVDRTFYRDHLSDQIVYKEMVTMELKVQEYIDKLEKENKEMKSYIEEIKKLLKDGI